MGSVFTHEVALLRWKSADVHVCSAIAWREMLNEFQEGYIVIWYGYSDTEGVASPSIKTAAGRAGESTVIVSAHAQPADALWIRTSSMPFGLSTSVPVIQCCEAYPPPLPGVTA